MHALFDLKGTFCFLSFCLMKPQSKQSQVLFSDCLLILSTMTQKRKLMFLGCRTLVQPCPWVSLQRPETNSRDDSSRGARFAGYFVRRSKAFSSRESIPPHIARQQCETDLGGAISQVFYCQHFSVTAQSHCTCSIHRKGLAF